MDIDNDSGWGSDLPPVTNNARAEAMRTSFSLGNASDTVGTDFRRIFALPEDGMQAFSHLKPYSLVMEPPHTVVMPRLQRPTRELVGNGTLTPHKPVGATTSNATTGKIRRLPEPLKELC